MRFLIKALRLPDHVVQLEYEAANAEEAGRRAEEQGLKVLRVQRRFDWNASRWFSRERFPLALFSQELAILLNAGLVLTDALESLENKESDPQVRKILAGLIQALYEGKSLSAALSGYPWIFPPLFIALIKASERTGELGPALNRYVGYRASLDAMRQKVISASVYPVLLLGVGGLVLLFLIGYVVPRFSLVFEGMEHQLPWLSQVLIDLGNFLQQHQILLLPGLLGIIALGLLAARSHTLRRLVGRQIQRIPRLHKALLTFELARFYRSLGILLQGGIPVIDALSMASGLLGEQSRQHLLQAQSRVREGCALSMALETYGLSTPVALRMLRAGERSGNLGVMLERTADFHEAQTSRWIEWFVRLFEPLLMAFIGLLIGTIVVLMYIPIFELASSIQ